MKKLIETYINRYLKMLVEDESQQPLNIDDQCDHERLVDREVERINRRHSIKGRKVG